MKRAHLVAAASILAAGIFAVSCKKDIKERGADNLAVSATQITPANGDTLSGVLGTGKAVRDTIHLSGGTYYLSGLVYVDTLDVISIDAGTTVKGIVGAPGGGLVVTRGGKITAIGTSASPIVFTSAAASPAAGNTAGIIVLGKATTNQSDTARIEGIGGTAPADTHYGGSDDADNSGTLQYVRIEYAGYELSADNEINGLTLGGVGSGTTIDHVEVYKAADDGIEFFGGTVNANYLVIVNPLDDGLDFDNGYRGHIQFALVLEDSTRGDKSGSNGIESDNLATGDSTRTPITHPVLANISIIGLPNATLAAKTTFSPSGTGKYGYAAQFRRSSQFEVYNSVFLGFTNGIFLDNTATGSNTQYKYTDGTSKLQSVLVHAYTTPFASSPTYAGIAYPNNALKDSGYVSTNANAALLLTDPFNRTTTNFFVPLSAASPVVANGGSLPSYFTATTYSGAFNRNPTSWASGSWVKFAY